MTSDSDMHLLAALGARSLVLVGMMGAGKSSIGRKLAQRLSLPFVDADCEIEHAAGMSISRSSTAGMPSLFMRFMCRPPYGEVRLHHRALLHGYGSPIQ